MNPKTLPLGVDIGSTRLRVAALEVQSGAPCVRAVATRELSEGSSSSGEIADPEYVAALLEEAIDELGLRERRCICAVGEPDSLLRPITLPRMSAFERAQAIHLEAERFIDYPLEDAIVRTHPILEKERLFALGVVRSRVLASRLKTLKKAGLKVCAVDHEAFAFSRLLAEYDAVVDIGAERTSVHIYGLAAPMTFCHFSGGAEITRSIARELSIDLHAAEKRKRILGTSGAGDAARGALAREIASLFDAGRSRRGGAMSRIGMVGNAARLRGLRSDIESATGAIAEIAVGRSFLSASYPQDVVRSAAPDWSLAVGLATWGI